jgi:hypothetical protein
MRVIKPVKTESGMSTLTIRSSQKVFTEEEVSGLTGICLEHLRNLTRLKHLGRAAEAAAEAAESTAAKWFYSPSDLMVLNLVCRRCEH